MHIFKTIGCCLFIILSVARGTSGQVPELINKPAFRKDAQAAVDSLYNFNQKGAERALASWKKQYPADPFWKLLDGIEQWWRILSDLNDTSMDKHFQKIMKRADYAASKMLYDHPDHADALIVRMAANGYIARQYSDRSEWVASLSAARKAFEAYKHIKRVMPDFPDLELARGLRLYYAEYLPEAYPVVKTVSWVLPDGDKKKGLKDMREAAKQAIFARAEALYFLGNINYNYEHHYGKAVRYFTKLHQQYPNNNYYTRLLVKSLYKMGRYKKAMTAINTALKRWEQKDLPFQKVLDEELQYWKGRILLHHNEKQQALPLFKKSFQLSQNLPRSRHRDYYAAAAYYAGAVLADMGDNNQATAYFHHALDAKSGDPFKKMARDKLEAIRR